MRVSNYSVLVTGGHERDSGHVVLQHGSIYQLRLANHDHTRCCDAIVEIDGKEIANLRLDIGRTVNLETPPDDKSKGCFTFFKADSEQAVAAGQGSVAVDNRGLIKVTFKPEKKVQYIPVAGGTQQYCNAEVPKEYTHGPKYRGGASGQSVGSGLNERVLTSCFGNVEKTSGLRDLDCSSNVSSGITGLTGQSKQTFFEVPPLDHDESLTTVISLRLVADNNVVRELKPVQRMNPVPAVV